MIPLPFPPPMFQSTPRAIPLKEAVDLVMQDFDAEDPTLPLREPEVALTDQPSLRWLRSAAQKEIPENPFPKGTDSFAEATALLALQKADRAQAEGSLPKLKIQEPGSALALWRWARRQEQVKPWSPSARRAWEDKLLAENAPAVLNGYALRHALCWALAEKDEARFAELKATLGQDAPSLFASFQGLFGWLGALSPVLRLWVVPGLEYRDLRLDELLAFDGSKANRIWISPEATPLPQLPAGTAWIIPSATGSQNANETSLNPVEKSAGTSISSNLSMAKGHAYFEPSRGEFEPFGLVFFPVLIELDSKGGVQNIRMGDAVVNPLRSPATTP